MKRIILSGLIALLGCGETDLATKVKAQTNLVAGTGGQLAVSPAIHYTEIDYLMKLAMFKTEHACALLAHSPEYIICANYSQPQITGPGGTSLMILPRTELSSPKTISFAQNNGNDCFNVGFTNDESSHCNVFKAIRYNGLKIR